MFKKKKTSHAHSIGSEPKENQVERITNGVPTVKDAITIINSRDVPLMKACLKNLNTPTEALAYFVYEYNTCAGIGGGASKLDFLKVQGLRYWLTHPNLTNDQIEILLWAALTMNQNHAGHMAMTNDHAKATFERFLISKLSNDVGYFKNSAYLRLFELNYLDDEVRLILIKSADLVEKEVKENVFKRLLSNANLSSLALKRLIQETDSEIVLKLIGLHKNVTLELINLLPKKLQALALDNFNMLKEQEAEVNDKVIEDENYKPLIDPENPEELAISQKRKDELKVITKRFTESRSLAKTLLNKIGKDLPFEIQQEFKSVSEKATETLAFYKEVTNGPLTLQGEKAHQVATLHVENALKNYESIINSFLNLLELSQSLHETSEQFDTLRIDTKAWSDIKVFESKL